MSQGESSRRPSLRPETTHAPESRRSRSRILSDLLERPERGQDRALVKSPSPRHDTRTSSAFKASPATQRSTSRPAAERYRDTSSHFGGARGSWGYSSSEDNDDDEEEEEGNVNIRFNRCGAKDVVVRLYFNVYQDLDDELEEFSRLVRRGEFGIAKTFFGENLLAHITCPWVFVQYSEMLCQMGDYRSLLQLDPEPVFRPTQLRDEHEDVEAMRRLEINWRLLKATCLCHTQHELWPVLDEICQPDQITPVRGDIGSTEIRIICLAMSLMAFANGRILNLIEFPVHFAHWGDWEQVYELLQAQGRIWDFRDLFITACLCFSIGSAEEELLGSRTILEAIAQDWSILMNHDESTLLALIDLLTTLAVYAINHDEDERLGKEYLAYASTLVETVTTTFPHCSKSRPLLRFIVIKSSILQRTGRGIHLAYTYLRDFPGLAGFSACLDLPFYVPVRRENPGWDPLDLPENALGPLEMVLEASRSMDEYQMQALCLKALALRSREPSGFFQELVRVQKDRQQDMDGYLTTCLSKYLLVKDQESNESLLADLNGFGGWQEISNVLVPDKGCARDIIRHALSSSHQTHFSKSVEAGSRYYEWLPDAFQRFLSNHMESPQRKSSTPMRERFKRSQSIPKTAIPVPLRPPVAEPRVVPPPASPVIIRQSALNRDSDDSEDDYREDPVTARWRVPIDQLRTIPEEQEHHTDDDDRLILVEEETGSRPLHTKPGPPPTTAITSRPTVEDEAGDEQRYIY